MSLHKSALRFSLVQELRLPGACADGSPPLRAGPLGRDRPAWAAAWVEAALQGGMAALPPPMPGARLTLPNGKLRTAVAPISSPALAARSPLSGGGRNGTRRAGAVVTTPAPSLLPTRVEGQSPARRAGEVTGARPTPDERQGEHGDPGRACALSGAERWQPASSTPPATLASPAEHSGEALLTAGIRATSSAEGGPGPGAIGSALEARVRDSVERQLVAAVEAVVGGGREGATGTRGSRCGHSGRLPGQTPQHLPNRQLPAVCTHGRTTGGAEVRAVLTFRKPLIASARAPAVFDMLGVFEREF